MKPKVLLAEVTVFWLWSLQAIWSLIITRRYYELRTDSDSRTWPYSKLGGDRRLTKCNMYNCELTGV